MLPKGVSGCALLISCFLSSVLFFLSGSPLEVPRLNSRLLSGMCGILLFFTSIMHTLLYSHLSDKLISKRTLIQCLNYPLKTPRFTDYLIPLVGVVFYSQLIKRFLDLNTKWQGVVTALPDAAVPQKGIESVRLMHHDLCQANLNFNYYHGLQFLIFFLSIFLKLVTDLAFFLYLYIPDIELQCVVYVGYFINFTLFLAVSGSLLRVKQRVSCEVKKLQLSNLSSKCVSQVLLYLGQIKTDRCEVVANGFAHFDRPFMISIISATATALIVIIQMGPNTFHLTQADIEDDCC
ncbi:uncharacterized protein [Bemisia tabaci]|uniref:uncharacterized protein n=1 Tax=Bemisia tabaci TaxID=7038 RepID=UPI003B27C3AC